MVKKIGVLLFCLLFGLMPMASCNGKNNDSESISPDEPKINYNLKTAELPFRDICVLADSATQTYYMIGFLKSASSAQEIAL